VGAWAHDHDEGLTEAKFLYITALEGSRDGVKAPQPQAIARNRVAEAQIFVLCIAEWPRANFWITKSNIFKNEKKKETGHF
jgi:hypothetical protein